MAKYIANDIEVSSDNCDKEDSDYSDREGFPEENFNKKTILNKRRCFLREH